MKATEIRELSAEEITEKIDSLEEELFNLRFQAKMGQLSNPLQLRFVRRQLARTKTVLKEKSTTEKA
ncbi:MAG: 50S ribosomal protein L29 [Chitinispirillaceae bacterium]